MRDVSRLLLYWVSGVDGPTGALEGGVVRPATDVVECDDRILITVELAGVAREDLSASLVGQRLEIRGMRRPREQEDGGVKRYLRREIVYAPFERVLVLPADIDESSFEAEYRDGMLRIAVRRRPPEPEPVHRVTIR
ncbi:MAG TPA: Hsp20/alpha crystallin family protein [Thermodesulfobacteriota bacterium]